MQTSFKLVQSQTPAIRRIFITFIALLTGSLKASKVSTPWELLWNTMAMLKKKKRTKENSVPYFERFSQEDDEHRPVISPQFYWQVLLGPHQIKSGGYTRLVTPMHFVAQQGEDRWPCTWPVLNTWPPCQWSEISFSVPQCSFLLLKSVSSAHVVFTWQPTDFMVCPAGQFASFISWKCLQQASMAFTRPWEDLPFFAEAASAMSVPSQIFATYHQDSRRHCWPSAEVLTSEIPKTTEELVSSLALPAIPSFPVVEALSTG